MQDFVIPEQITNRCFLFGNDFIDQADGLGGFHIKLCHDTGLMIGRPFERGENRIGEFLIERRVDDDVGFGAADAATGKHQSGKDRGVHETAWENTDARKRQLAWPTVGQSRYDGVMNGTCGRLLLFCWLGVMMALPVFGQSGGEPVDRDSENGDLLRISGRHLELRTDLSSQQADDLVAAYDAAVPQWEKFWALPPGTLDSWKVDAYIMRDHSEFRRRNLLPPREPDFRHGYALGNEVWVVAQPSQYYTRHLLLHEGVHALMLDQFGGAGPAWYMEGTAEMLSTHQGSGGEVIVNHVPRRREEVPYWGRFKVIQSRRETGIVPSLGGVMAQPLDLNGDVESYAWSWASTMILYAYPEYRDAFYAAARNGRDTSEAFNDVIRRRLASQWPVLAARWRLMCRELDYGFDWQRERVMISTKDPLWRGETIELSVAASQGWQSAGVRFAPGTTLSVTSSGTCTLAETTAPWVSQPDGITIRYENDFPIGTLMACIVPNAPASASAEPVLERLAIGASGDLVFKEYAWLLLRINDAIGERSDNLGGYQVEIERKKNGVETLSH